ncbi:MAG: carbon-nitrogen hydrolase family protein [Candidatus Zixiibacteriota bacterium]
MKALLVQKNINDVDCEQYLKQAESRGAGLVAFGELATTGCLYQPREVDSLDKLLTTLSRYDVRVLIGVPYADGDCLRDSCLYYEKGNYQIYNKINLFEPMNEPSVYRRGDKPGLFETDFGRVGVAICYDLRFDNVFADLKSGGAGLLFVIAAWPRVRVDAWKQLLMQRAREHAVRVIGINSVGDDGTNVFGGTSLVVAADGSILAEADETTETVLKVEL